MTPSALREARRKLGLSQRAFAAALRPAQPPGERSVRRWEAGAQDVPRWVEARTAELLTRQINQTADSGL